MNTKMYVGNLSFSVTESDVNELFSAFGRITEVNLITDRDTGKLRGFGFVTMESHEETLAAIKELDGKDFQGRPLKVNEAKERVS